jgi:hypothetical protein
MPAAIANVHCINFFVAMVSSYGVQCPPVHVVIAHVSLDLSRGNCNERGVAGAENQRNAAKGFMSFFQSKRLSCRIVKANLDPAGSAAE